MQEPLLSSDWYRVADLKPRLRSHAHIHHHVYRGHDWYVLQDHATGRFHRFSPEAYLIIGLMDGRHTLDEIWETVYKQLEDNTPTQNEVITLLSQLHRADVLQSGKIPNIDDLLTRSVRGRHSRWLSYIRSPLAVRFPLLDPDRFLNRTKHLVYPLFGWTCALVHGSTVLIALILVVIHWGELTSNVTDRVFSLENLLLIGLIYPFVKVIHEFGHAYAVKRWGGEVHEMGVMFLVFVPIPYLDASSASAVREKYKRVVVGAAGLFIEMFIAALAVFVWVSVEPGAVRAVAFNILLIAGVSTLLFNGNPLLRYDAYYILSDVLEIPNLGTRANSYIGYLIQNYVFGINEVHSTANTQGEAIWLAIYSVASSIYRIFIVVAICLVAAKRFFALGVLIAIWAAFSLLVVPFVFTVRFLMTNVYIRKRRTRVIIVCAVTACLVIFCTLVMPMPLFTIAEGVVWAPKQSEVRTEVDGFVDEVLAVPGQTVRRGASLIRIENPELTAHARLLEAQLLEYQARKLAAMSSDRTEMKIVQDEIDRIRAELDEIREQLANLVIRSRINGTFLLPRAEDLPERFVKRGTQMGYVVDFSNITVRVVVPQSLVSRVRTNTRKVEARLSGTVSEIIPAKVIREVPEASSDLPSLALSLEGGGAIALDPTGLKEPQAFQRYFQFDIVLSQVPLSRIGERVFVRFIHNPEPLAYRWYRSIRRLLLRRFSI